MSIFEPPIRNSGIIGGKFLERSEVLKPNGVQPYVASDLYVGAKLEIFRRLFELVEADDYTYAHMESQPRQFPASDFSKIINVVRGFLVGSKDVETQLRLAFIEMDADGSGYLSREELGQALAKVCEQSRSKHSSCLLSFSQPRLSVYGHNSILSPRRARPCANPHTQAGITLSVQQIITIHRKYDTSRDGKISINELFAAFGLTFEE